MAHVRLEGISKTFGGQAAVSDLDLDIEDGQFFVLLGPTGAGKTTTLRLIAGLERPDSGTVYIDQQNVNRWSSGPAGRRSRAAAVFALSALHGTGKSGISTQIAGAPVGSVDDR